MISKQIKWHRSVFQRCYAYRSKVLIHRIVPLIRSIAARTCDPVLVRPLKRDRPRVSVPETFRNRDRPHVSVSERSLNRDRPRVTVGG